MHIVDEQSPESETSRRFLDLDRHPHRTVSYANGRIDDRWFERLTKQCRDLTRQSDMPKHIGSSRIRQLEDRIVMASIALFHSPLRERQNLHDLLVRGIQTMDEATKPG